MADLKQIADQKREPKPTELLSAIRSRLNLIAPEITISRAELSKADITLCYATPSGRAKVRVARPTSTKAAADAVLYHARHFGDFHSPDLTPVESKQVECSSKIKISHDEARKRIESVVRSNRSNERP